jgi:hypothetical protein
MSDVMAWQWIAASVTVPLAVALAVAWPIWRRPTRDPVGSLTGAGITLAFALLFMGREYVHVESLFEHCNQLGAICVFTPAPYARYFFYISVAFAQTIVLFIIGGRIEHRRRESRIAPEWRR